MDEAVEMTHADGCMAGVQNHIALCSFVPALIALQKFISPPQIALYIKHICFRHILLDIGRLLCGRSGMNLRVPALGERRRRAIFFRLLVFVLQLRFSPELLRFLHLDGGLCRSGFFVAIAIQRTSSRFERQPRSLRGLRLHGVLFV